MAIEFKYQIKDEIIFSTASGNVKEVEEVKAYGKSLIDLCKKNKLNKVISDERNVKYSLSQIELYSLATYYRELLNTVIKSAIVCRDEEFDNTHFWETVSVNRGLNVKVFTDIKKARRWVGE
ncbi:MAG: hypothetical protein K8F36_07260 [Melioribacteraceae bacterium]|nr:hypothetical protein [Melioribacteraceae bacterium]MCO6472233.1 hypothetical protein [Melioribacteraceae bacterium]MDD3559791.1 hypothetical protein [Melioribacteraceae bacterium]